MSYIALATDQFDAMVRFYGETLRFPRVDGHDRPGARACVFDLHGLRVEILDNTREKHAMKLGDANDRLHLVVEVGDVDAVHRELMLDVPPPRDTSWGTRVFSVRDPDGTPVWFVQKRPGPVRG